jgi:hypothetical protein
MRAAITAAAITATALSLAGCYSVLMLNLGVNRNATALAAPLDEDVFCAALAAPIIKAAPTDQRGSLEVHEINVCHEALEAQRTKATRAKR